MARIKGKIRVPPPAQFVIFVDRDDGTEWVLGYTTDDEGTWRITLNDEGIGSKTDFYRYEADDGLNMGRGVRLFVRGGRLGYEMVQYDLRDPPPHARVGYVKAWYELIIPAGWTPGTPDAPPHSELGVNDESPS